MYCDEGIADRLRTHKSTFGCFIALAGNNTFISIAAIRKKQICVSLSSRIGHAYVSIAYVVAVEVIAGKVTGGGSTKGSTQGLVPKLVV